MPPVAAPGRGTPNPGGPSVDSGKARRHAGPIDASPRLRCCQMPPAPRRAGDAAGDGVCAAPAREFTVGGRGGGAPPPRDPTVGPRGVRHATYQRGTRLILSRGSGGGGGARPPWPGTLRALREARGVTQEGWAARLGVSRKTVQRWESGARAPDPGAESALLRYCREAGLLRAFQRGPLSGLTLSEEGLRDLLAEARWRGPGGAPGGRHSRPGRPAPARGAGRARRRRTCRRR